MPYGSMPLISEAGLRLFMPGALPGFIDAAKLAALASRSASAGDAHGGRASHPKLPMVATG